MGINFGNGTGMGIKSEASWEWKWDEIMEMGGKGNVASHSRTRLMYST